MTGNGDGQLVRRTGARNGANRFGRVDASGNVGIGNGVSDRNVLQGLPDPLLECRAAHIKRKIQTDARVFNTADHARHGRLIGAVRADQPGLGESILKVPDQFVRIVSQQYGHNPFLLDATRRSPSEVCPTANLISSSAPPDRYCDGVIPSILVDCS